MEDVNYSDMTPESRNSLLIGNGGKQVTAEMYTHGTIEEFLCFYATAR
jgi:hypothetical protein